MFIGKPAGVGMRVHLCVGVNGCVHMDEKEVKASCCSLFSRLHIYEFVAAVLEYVYLARQ